MSEQVAFPFQLQLCQIKSIQATKAESLTLFLIISGEVTIEIEGEGAKLSENDIVIINAGKSYALQSENENLVLRFSIERSRLAVYFPGELIPIFECIKTPENQNRSRFQKLREALLHLTVNYYQESSTESLIVFQYLFAVLAVLVQEFKQEPSLNLPEQKIEDDKVLQVMQYVAANYQQHLSLATISEHLFISYSYLSRQFKKETGWAFTQYVTHIRLKKAQIALQQTENTLLQVALNAGFANSKTFHKAFKEAFKQTPNDYRKNYHQQQSKTETMVRRHVDDYFEIKRPQAIAELAKFQVKNDFVFADSLPEQRVKLSVQNHASIKNDFFKAIIRVNSAFDLLQENVCRELRILQKKLHFKYIQFEGFYPQDDFAEDDVIMSGNMINNQIFDLLLDLKLLPIIQLKISDETLSLEKQQEWLAQQIKYLVAFANRYGAETISKWRIEWFFGPKLSAEQSLTYYLSFQKLLKKIKLKIEQGVFAIDGLDAQQYQRFQKICQRVNEEQEWFQFVSFDADPYCLAIPPEAQKRYAVQVMTYQMELIEKIKSVFEQEWSDQPQPVLLLTGWNTLAGDGNTLSGTFYRSALMMENLLALNKEVSGISFWLNIENRPSYVKQNDNTCISIFLHQALKRPIFHVLSLLKELKGEIIAESEKYLLIKQADSYRILLLNSSYLDPSLSLDAVQVQYQTQKINLVLKDLPTGNYSIKTLTLDKDNGGIYNDWVALGSYGANDLEIIDYLENCEGPKLHLKCQNLVKGSLEQEVILTFNACQLIILKPLR